MGFGMGKGPRNLRRQGGGREAFDKWFRAEQLIADHIDTTFISSAFLPYKAFQAGASWQRTQSAPVVPEGYAIVPVEPTPELFGRYLGRPLMNMDRKPFESWADEYRRIVASAPAQPAALKFTECSCGGGDFHGHTAECQYEHFLSYSSLKDDPSLRYAYIQGIGGQCEQPAAQGEFNRAHIMDALLMWNRRHEEPPIRVGYEYGVAEAVLDLAAAQDHTEQSLGMVAHDQGEVQRLREALERATKLLSAAAGYATKMEPMPAKLLNAIDAELDASTGQEV